MPTQTGSYDFLAAKASHDSLQEQIDPIATKTYTGIIGTANTAADASFYFAKVHPDDYNGVWQVKLRINVTAPVLYQEIVDVTVSGRASAYMAYDAVSHRSNSALAISYLNLYRAKQAGITAGKGHALGFGLRGSTNPANATYARTITVEVLEQVNCTVQLLDAAVKYASMDGTGTTNYDALTELYIGAYGQNATNNANTYDRILYNSNVKAAANLTAGRIVCGNSAGYRNIEAGTVFDVSYPLLYNNTAYSSGGVRADLDLVRVNIAFSNNGTIESAAAHSMVYLKGTVIGNAFTIAAAPFLTCKVPTEADGFCYLPLGRLRDSTTNGQFTSSHELWCFKDGAFGPVSLREASLAAKTATNYITKHGSGDTWIHAEGMGPDSSNNPTSTTRGWRIGDALDLFRGTLSMMKAWVDSGVAKVRVGLESAGHSVFSPDGMEVFTDASTSVARFGETVELLPESSSGSASINMLAGKGSIKYEANDTGISDIGTVDGLTIKSDDSLFLNSGNVASVTALGDNYKKSRMSLMSDGLIRMFTHSNVNGQSSDECYSSFSMDGIEFNATEWDDVAAQELSSGSYLQLSPDGSFSVQLNDRTRFHSYIYLTKDSSGSQIGVSDHKIENGYFTNINGVAVGTSPKFTDTTALTSMTGTLAKNHGGTGITNLGAVTNADGSTAVSTTSGTAKALKSVSLAAGSWLILGYVWFASSASGRRAAKISGTSADVGAGIGCMITAPASGTNTELCVMTYVQPTATDTYYLNAYQNSGSALNAACYIRAIRLG